MSRDLPLKEGRGIDYLADYERSGGRGGGMGVLEMIDLDIAIFGGTASAAEIAAETGVAVRTVQRRRALLRGRGFRVPVPDREISEAQRENVRRSVRARTERRALLSGKQAEVAA